MADALVFDLDDTLFAERDFVASGYRAVARHIAGSSGRREHEVFDYMMRVFEAHGRERVLESVMDRFMDSSASVSGLVDVYRRHMPAIRLFAGYREILTQLRSEFKLGILTDGLHEVQKRKVEALGLSELMDAIVYTWEYGSELEKPHPFGFGLILARLGAAASGSLFVGDNPRKDGRGAHNAGMRFIQVAAEDGRERTEGDPAQEKADFVIKNLHELPVILQQAR